MGKTLNNQSEKFKRAARELGADTDDEAALKRAIEKMGHVTDGEPSKSDKPKKDE